MLSFLQRIRHREGNGGFFAAYVTLKWLRALRADHTWLSILMAPRDHRLVMTRPQRVATLCVTVLSSFALTAATMATPDDVAVQLVNIAIVQVVLRAFSLSISWLFTRSNSYKSQHSVGEDVDKLGALPMSPMLAPLHGLPGRPDQHPVARVVRRLPGALTPTALKKFMFSRKQGRLAPADAVAQPPQRRDQFFAHGHELASDVPVVPSVDPVASDAISLDPLHREHKPLGVLAVENVEDEVAADSDLSPSDSPTQRPRVNMHSLRFLDNYSARHGAKTLLPHLIASRRNLPKVVRVDTERTAPAPVQLRADSHLHLPQAVRNASQRNLLTPLALSPTAVPRKLTSRWFTGAELKHDHPVGRKENALASDVAVDTEATSLDLVRDRVQNPLSVHVTASEEEPKEVDWSAANVASLLSPMNIQIIIECDSKNLTLPQRIRRLVLGLFSFSTVHVLLLVQVFVGGVITTVVGRFIVAENTVPSSAKWASMLLGLLTIVLCTSGLVFMHRNLPPAAALCLCAALLLELLAFILLSTAGLGAMVPVAPVALITGMHALLLLIVAFVAVWMRVMRPNPVRPSTPAKPTSDDLQAGTAQQTPSPRRNQRWRRRNGARVKQLGQYIVHSIEYVARLPCVGLACLRKGPMMYAFATPV